MIHWFRKRFDRAQTKVRPSSSLRRARRLSMERCEDRRMLSGDTLGLDVVPLAPGTNGGFLSFDSVHLFSAGADNFLSTDGGIDLISSSATLFRFSDAEYSRGTASDFVSLDAAPGLIPTRGTNADFSEIVSSRYTVNVVTELQLASSLWGATTNQINLGDGNITVVAVPTKGTIVAPPADTNPPEIAASIISDPSLPSISDVTGTFIGPSLHPTEGVIQSPDIELEVPNTGVPNTADPPLSDVDSSGNPLGQPVGGSPGLPGSSPRLLIIDDPVQVLATYEADSQRPRDEGGAIQVFAAVAETQQAYEVQLASAVVDRLNNDEALPTPPQHESRPVLAQLARSVTFETAHFQPAAQADSPSTRARSDVPAPQPDATDFEAKLPATKSDTSDSTAQESGNDETTISLRTFRPPATLSKHIGDEVTLAERIDKKQEATLATTFASWPVFASVIAGYLVAERRHSHERSVQTPPRRQRTNSSDSV